MTGNLSIKARTQETQWSPRCEYWRSQKSILPQQRNRQENTALILSGFGVSLRVDGGTLKIKNGFTHYPQKQDVFRYFRGDADLPDRIILLDCTGSLSFDVMTWLSEQGVTLIKLDWRGQMTCLAAPGGFSANPFRASWQHLTRADGHRRMAFCNKLIVQKIENSITALENMTPRNDAWERAMRTSYAALTRLEERPAQDVAELRGIEGTAAAAYFRVWTHRPIKWMKRSRRPIPPAWRKIGIRHSGHFTVGNKNAHHPVNAMLNYAYGILESRVRIGAIAEGYDPSIGIMHESRRDSSAFVLDLMEIYRAETDQRLFGFLKNNEFDPMDFTIREDGVCRLNPDLTRALVATVDSEKTRVTSMIPRWVAELG